MATTIREKLISLLSDAGGYKSGQKLSEILGCSRTAVWKHIEELRKEGYVVEAVQKKGYRIITRPNNLLPGEIKHQLNTEKLGQEIHYEESVSSTQEIAHRHALNNAPEGTIVIADEQTSGRGRLGRSWHSPKGSGVWMSVILRPNIPPQKAPQLTLLAAVSVVQGVQQVTGEDAQIKWPNDILIDGKKVVGILTELQAEADRVNSVIIGIGINVNTAAFPDEISNIATSLKIASGTEIERAHLVRSILEKMEKLYTLYLEHGFSPIKLLWEGSAASLGKRIRVRTIAGELYGKAQGITEEGVLLVEDDLGTVHRVYSADIELTQKS
ncbi:biotin--[acetyl-CoA-carboxylase] ligase [Pseudalkalibacillus salsuginis]|uniref:biotin--[acetyl-CoA-carboxylase] ligase n=1 Tax=Pseudalkalibacillus salsuginis TaxID=2910972 RepID=UPI001F281677|nr:biotin--[acetyl-CoA-carboxylase] ligase [Pseudalkalibacillus salsuginis]MCF6408209.1 biotin--[acetyl-CoA-carboxylase] ligase [Pseudalkalibacillus salsuginis]